MNAMRSPKQSQRGRHISSAGLIGLLAISVSAVWAQPPARLVSPEVLPDNRVTFRFRDANAQSVTLTFGGGKPQAMVKDEQGVWSLTTDPLEPDFYSYGFTADGVILADPSNPLLKPNLLSNQSQVHVPGPAALAWEMNDVPHGIVHRHFYHSAVAGDQRDFYVYTPPGYDPRARQTYPVLYLLHGQSDDASGWISIGRAEVILDNLIAQGKARPMLLVMPLGYGVPDFVPRISAAPGLNDLRQRNFDKFREALLGEVIPQVEAGYRVRRKREARAIAGLSMGGAESLLTGLNHLNEFAWIGSFSAGGMNEDFATEFPALDAKANSQIRLLWVACGTDDGLIKINRTFRDWLKAQGVGHVDIETPGGHSWVVWRRNLVNFAPLLFR